MKRPRILSLCRITGLASVALALAAAPSLAAPSLASAQESDVIVLGIRSVEGDDEFARNLTSALRNEASQVQGWGVSDREVTLAQMALAHGCDEPDPTCMSAIAQSLEARRLLYGEVRRTSAGDSYDFSLNLHLFDASTGEIEHSVADTIPGIRRDIDDLRAPARRYVAALSGAPRLGTLNVSVNVPGAEVFVDGESVGVADEEGHLLVENVASGSRSIRVAATGHQSFRSTVSVEAYGEADFEAELQAAPGGGGGGGFPVGAAIGGGLIALGVASAGLWIWSMVEVDNINNTPEYVNLRDNETPLDMDVCEYHIPEGGSPSGRAGEFCSRGATFEALQFVFLGTAVISAGIGTFLLIDGLSGGDGEAADPEAVTLQLTPSFSDRHGYVGLRGTF